jgi:hypothetical protein
MVKTRLIKSTRETSTLSHCKTIVPRIIEVGRRLGTIAVPIIRIGRGFRPFPRPNRSGEFPRKRLSSTQRLCVKVVSILSEVLYPSLRVEEEEEKQGKKKAEEQPCGKVGLLQKSTFRGVFSPYEYNSYGGPFPLETPPRNHSRSAKTDARRSVTSH